MGAYIAIDLKSFYASVECAERGFDPLNTNLVVADESRTEKTICLAVSPALKKLGIPGRARLFEVIEKVNAINVQRRMAAGGEFNGVSCMESALKGDKRLKLDFVIAPPRMTKYMEYSRRVYSVYLKYISPDDIHVYSIDEVFIDAGAYLKTYGLTPRELAAKLIKEVKAETGITATAGVGTNLYLCKVAMDIVAKHVPEDADGVRLAELDEMSYRKTLWTHRPLTDFWRVGRGAARRLERLGLYTMGDVARCSLNTDVFYNQALLFKEFGVNAELLIDHAWGRESCLISDIKAYKPRTNSISSGQVLARPYSFTEARLVIGEMARAAALELNSKELVTDRVDISIHYDSENLLGDYSGNIARDFYGRDVPKPAHAGSTLKEATGSARTITDEAQRLFDGICDRRLSIRRLGIALDRLKSESQTIKQLSLFDDEDTDTQRLEKEKKQLRAVIDIKNKYGKNAIMRLSDLESAATERERNGQIGGHKA